MKTPKGPSGVKKTCRAILPLLGAGAGILALSALAQGQVTKYDIIMKQLLLQDFTVIQVILSAVVTGMIGIFALKKYRLAQLHLKAGSFDSTVPGSLIFGNGFALLG